VELNAWQERFEEIGVNVAGMTYDDREALSDFAWDRGLGYALLSDPDGEYMAGLGIRNEEYGPGHPGFGIPHPGVMLIDPSGTILYKVAEEDYRERPAFDAVFDAVREAVSDNGTAAVE
jgi:peroxiredoxin